MSERQKKRFILSAVNGMNIEAIGTRDLKSMAELFSDFKLTVRYLPTKNKP